MQIFSVSRFEQYNRKFFKKDWEVKLPNMLVCLNAGVLNAECGEKLIEDVPQNYINQRAHREH